MFSAQNRENEFSSKYSAFEKSFHGLASAADSFGYTRIYENIFFFYNNKNRWSKLCSCLNVK